MSEQIPSLNSLRAFEVVSRHLNYHSAANELNVSAAAVKQLVSKLEDNIGKKLLERKGQGLILTSRGRASCADLTAAMGKMYSSVEKMRREEEQQQLIVTVETSFATAWLVPRLVQFRVDHPHINVLIDSSQQIVDLDKNKVDVAIRYGVKSPPNLYIRRLFDDQVFPACSPSLAQGPPVIKSLNDLNGVPLIHWNMSQQQWSHRTKQWFSWKSWLTGVEADDINIAGGLHFSDYGLAVQAAIAGQGMILASWPILKEPIDSEQLVCPFKERITTDIGYDLVTTRRAHSRPEVKAFADWVIETARCK